MNRGQALAFLAFASLIAVVAYHYLLAEKELASSNSSHIHGLNSKIIEELRTSLQNAPKREDKIAFLYNSNWQQGHATGASFSGEHYPSSIEQIMHSIASCIATAAYTKASLMGVKLTQFDVQLKGELDAHGLFKNDVKQQTGVIILKIKIIIGGKAPHDALKKIALFGYDYSPASESSQHGIMQGLMPEIVIVD